jgi:hypothetical protein
MGIPSRPSMAHFHRLPCMVWGSSGPVKGEQPSEDRQGFVRIIESDRREMHNRVGAPFRCRKQAAEKGIHSKPKRREENDATALEIYSGHPVFPVADPSPGGLPFRGGRETPCRRPPAMGHRWESAPENIGNVQSIWIDHRSGLYIGAADSTREGTAIGLFGKGKKK